VREPAALREEVRALAARLTEDAGRDEAAGTRPGEASGSGAAADPVE